MICGWFGGKCRFLKFNDFKKRNLFTDVSFIVEGDPFKAHKIVLSSRSEVFQTMFTTNMNEAACNEVRISDIKKNVFGIFLDYLYSGVISYEDVHNHYFELMYCADKYSIRELTCRCSDHLKGTFKEDTFDEVLRVACFFNVVDLKMHYIGRIAEYDDEDQKIEDSKGWKTMVSDFGLVREIVSSLSPTSVSLSYNVTPDVWDDNYAFFLSEGEEDVNLRVNGLEIKLSISLRALRNTLYGFARLFSHDYLDRAVEIPYTFTISTAEKQVIHSGQGEMWWVSGDLNDDDDRATCMLSCEREEYYRQRSLFPLFEMKFDQKPGVKNTRFIIDLALKQWEPPQTGTQVSIAALEPPQTPEMENEDHHLKNDVARLSADNKIFVVNRALYRKKGDFFRFLLSDTRDEYRIDGIDASTFTTIERFLSNNVIPDKDEVNDKLMVAACQLLLKDLVTLCERITATKLTVDNAVSTLILAKHLNMENLQRMVIEFIDSHHLKIVRLDSWTLLENHPDLNSSILKKMLGMVPYQGPSRRACERKPLDLPNFRGSETSVTEDYWSSLDSEDSENDDEHAEEQV